MLGLKRELCRLPTGGRESEIISDGGKYSKSSKLRRSVSPLPQVQIANRGCNWGIILPVASLDFGACP